MIIEINAGICPHCKDTIYSRANHDMIWCSCGACALDGGSYILGDKKSFGYIRTIGKQIPTTVKILDFESIKECKKALYDDWNTNQNKYGRIEG